MKEQSAAIFSRKKRYSGILITMVLLSAVLLGGTFSGFTAVKADKASPVENIELTVTGCNVMVKTLSNNVVGSSSAKGGFRYEVDEALYKLTATQNGSTMNIELESTGKPSEGFTDMAVIFIPQQQYGKITVMGNEAGVSLPPLDADLQMTNNNGAMSARVSKEFHKTIDFTTTGGSGSLVLSASADDYTLNLTGEKSAISVSPELPPYAPGTDYRYVKGNGKAAINLNIVKSSFSVSAADIDDSDAAPFTGRFDGEITDCAVK